MLTDETINHRLEEMENHSDPFTSLWPENCAGSRLALVIFVGPSPGGKKEEKRRDISLYHKRPLWNEPYYSPLKWSRGFKVSFQPLVESLFDKPYEDAAKLIARFNMDWMQNPESNDVSYLYMWEGCLYILPIIYECNPELIIPMDEKTFAVMQIALYNDGFKVDPLSLSKIKVDISTKMRKARHHHKIIAFKAIKGEYSFLVIKSLQHPARIFDPDYARRIGEAIRKIATQKHSYSKDEKP